MGLAVAFCIDERSDQPRAGYEQGAILIGTVVPMEGRGVWSTGQALSHAASSESAAAADADAAAIAESTSASASALSA